MGSPRRNRTIGSTGMILGLLVVFLVPISTNNACAQPSSLSLEQLGGIRIGGHVNSIVSSLDRDFADGSSGDTSAVDVNSLLFNMTFSPWVYVDAKVALLMEEGFDSGRPTQDFDVDEAYVTLSGNRFTLTPREDRRDLNASPWYLTMGKFYHDFATKLAYHTFDVISEPQTLALGETLESTVRVGYATRSTRVYVAAYSGDGPDFDPGFDGEELNDVYVGLEWSREPWAFSVNWKNNLNNSIVLSEELSAGEDATDGLNLFGTVGLGTWSVLQAAHVRALEEYEGGMFQGREPSATSVEWTFTDLARPGRRPLDLTLVYERTDDWFNHPESVGGFVADWHIFGGVTGSLEYIHREYDRDLATRDQDDLVSAQISVVFHELFERRPRTQSSVGSGTARSPAASPGSLPRLRNHGTRPAAEDHPEIEL